jgi:hypothetical protein
MSLKDLLRGLPLPAAPAAADLFGNGVAQIPARGTADAIEHLASGRAGGKVVITV